MQSSDSQAMTTGVRQCQRWACVTRLTQQMLRLADDSAWEQIADLEQMRREVLQACFDDLTTSSDADAEVEPMSVLLSLNEELMVMVRKARLDLVEQSKVLVQSRGAVSAYRSTKDAR